tara:strand:- start:1744 stop:2697 length:954 start_codon:yes stop_codon:yes gene_type:complete
VILKVGDEPLVSVVIPMFNAGRWIREALESVAAQTHSVHECIVVSDGSTDSGPEIVRQIEKQGSLPLTLVEIEHAGVSTARNVGIAAASGRFVALLDADDVWHKKKLELQLETMQRTGATMCTTGYALFDSETSRVRGVVASRRSDRAIHRWMALEGNGLLISSTAIIERSATDHLEGFDQRVSIGEDLEFTIRMQDVGAVVADSRVLVGYRVHPEQAHRRLDNVSENVARLYDLLPIERFGRPFAKRCRSNLDAHVGYSLLARGHPLKAFGWLVKAGRGDPRRLVTLPLYALLRRVSRRLSAWTRRIALWPQPDSL